MAFIFLQYQGYHKDRKLEPSSPKSHRDSLILEKAGLENDKSKSGATRFVSSFQELGLKAEIIGALSEIGIWVPSEIQCVGIPALLNGKSVLLRHEEALLSVKPKHPRAIVLCSSEELCDQSFQTAGFISRHAKLNSASKCGYGKSRISGI
ncbi:hypothetical protein V6N12_034513 [Hibiscus sabdariffa]|uniref:DEAD-box RNA helicase Q domain-containing protein n=1 Tax=Hibiscus sabdariffa TaxID=183260 RepID=A0ABR2DHC4_9ROSI